MTDREQIATEIGTVEYRWEPSHDMQQLAKDAGLVIAFGYSDDNVELRGAVYDEVGAYSGVELSFTTDGLHVNGCDNDRCPNFTPKGVKVRAEYGDDGCWRFECPVPHSTFTMLDGDDVFCIGIVFALADCHE